MVHLLLDWFLMLSGDFKVKEIFNFTQDDLTTEEILLLDCHNEVYLWIGQHANILSKQQALILGKKYLEADILLQGMSSETAIYVITEGHEPSFFTRFFAWDYSKSSMHGNSFERKLAILKGLAPKLESPKRGSRIVFGTRYSEATPNGSTSQLVNSDGLRARSGSPASRVLTTSNDAKSRRLSCPAPVARKLFPVSSPRLSVGNEVAKDLPSKNAQHTRIQKSKDESLESPLATEDLDVGKFSVKTVADSEGIECYGDLEIFPYERLKVACNDPITGIDVTKREAYLSNEEFWETFGMTKIAFYKLPKWRQNNLKKAVNLF